MSNLVEQAKERVKESLVKNPDGSATHTVTDGQRSFSVNISAEALENMLVRVVKAAKEPDEATAAKLAEEKRMREENMRVMLQFAKDEEASKKRAQDNCRHTKPDGSTRVHAGQIYSDGKMRPICTWCQKVFPAYDAPREYMGGTGVA